MNALGRHILLELHDCNKEVLNDPVFLRRVMLDAAVSAGAEILGDSFHHFSPQGVSGVVIIAESHLSIHTWPEYGYAAVDVFTCGVSVDPKKAARVLIEKLGSRNHSMMEVPRGVLVTV
ncbi:MAG: adenosylmethionine decarboxylase [Dehalococcoidales bacterium]|nr:adenosylmethionine decarboxylase [Dehalococcoidales bacterium]